MPIKTSGALALIADIEAEFSQGADNISLAQAGVDAGLDAGDLGMFEFYGLSDVTAATVTTSAASSVTTNSMTLNGDVTGDGGGTISSRGFYFGTSSTYTSNTKYTVGSGTGAFSSARTGLSSSTTYYITAFAINEAGEVVGSTVSRATATPLVFSNRRFDINECVSATVRYYYAANGVWNLYWTATGSSDQQRSVSTSNQSRLYLTSSAQYGCNTTRLYSSWSGYYGGGSGYGGDAGPGSLIFGNYSDYTGYFSLS